MPDLPTLTLSQTHFDMVTAAFPGATLTDKANAYKAWLTNNLIDFVASKESTRLDAKYNADRDAAISNYLATLPPKVPFPPA